MEQIKIALVSLGCAKNLVDSETILALLQNEGFILSTNPGEADVIIINTCGFIDAAKDESIGKILELAQLKEKNCRLLLAAGCMAQRYGEELLKEIPELDGLFGTNDVYGAALAVRKGLEGKKVVLTQGQFMAPEDAPRILATERHTAFLKIADGCDNRCTYCAIPAIRGPYRSRDSAAVLAEATSLADSGVRELNLIAQDITLYGADRAGSPELPILLAGLSAIPEIRWIRLLYAYPERITEDIIASIARTDKVCRYLDLPVQHGSDAILRRMGRKMKAENILRLIEKLRTELPGIVLRSSFIVGFPGEGEEEFTELLEFLKAARFDRAGVFTYSREEGTPAARFRRQVPEVVKQERMEQVLALQSTIAAEKQRSLTGTVLEALVEGRSARDNSITLARTYMQAPEVDGYLLLRDTEASPGTFLPARITGFAGYDLLAEPV